MLIFIAALILLILINTASTNSSYAKQQDSFSWKNLIGKSIQEFNENTSGFCDEKKTANYSWIQDKFTPIHYYIYTKRKSTGFRFGYWPNDSISSYEPDREYHSFSGVKTLKCMASSNQLIEAYAWNDNVFDIKITYYYCPPISVCPKREKSEVDIKFSSLIGLIPMYTFNAMQSLGIEALNSYSKKRDIYESDNLLSLLFSDAAQCSSTNTIETAPTARCIVAKEGVENGIWHSISVDETFEKGFFGEKNIQRYADSQRFTDIELFKGAWSDYTANAQPLLDKANEASREDEYSKYKQQDLKNKGFQAIE